VIPAQFEYHRATSIDDALSALAADEDAKLLAGGHSLLPLMKLRLAQPSTLIDIGRLSELSYVRDAGDHIAIGALTRHRDVETSELLHAQCGLVSYVASFVGDPQVRHRGTIGGSIAHADPASDLPSAVLAVGGSMVIRSAAGERVVDAKDFFVGFLESAIQPGEILTEIRVPKLPGAGFSYQKFNRRAQDWAIVGVAAVHNGHTGIGLTNMGSTPIFAAAASAAASGGGSAADAAEVAGAESEPQTDLNASAEYRNHLVKVLTKRALIAAGMS
jgi:aerobic carbon-monoxide dehydrogenase medium subunit